jgi:lipopolysaccharide biosynthesis glycosyltransferase
VTPFPVFIGYDPREAVAYHVCCQSIIENSSIPVAFIPVTGERRDGSNAFIYERFLVPHMMRFQGRALFIDGDMIVRGDIAELVDSDLSCAGVRVVKHDYKTKYQVKYLGNKNEDYPRKNWSSVVLWNCGFYPNRVLTPEFVAKQPGSYLHRFSWLADDQIGSLPAAWNHLCMEYPENPDAKLYHYTLGIPAFDDYQAQEGADEWRKTLTHALAPM